jgi:ribosomal protein L1
MTVIKAIRAERPASVKGVFIKSITISSTMGVGVPVAVQSDAE